MTQRHTAAQPDALMRKTQKIALTAHIKAPKNQQQETNGGTRSAER